MNPNATETRLREIAERENKATNGPWNLHGIDVNRVTLAKWRRCIVFHGKSDACECEPKEAELLLRDAKFIAHSRQDVPWLLALVKKQREALKEIDSTLFGTLPSTRRVKQIARDALNLSPENL